MTALETKADAEALINKEGIEYVSVRFTDLIGVQQHFTVPASEFLKDAFTDGMPFDGSSVEGFQAINESDMKLVPDVSTAFIDPFRKHKTLDVAFSIVDPLTDEPYSRDPRQVAGKAEAYLKSTGIADTASFAPEAEFFIFDKVRFENSMQRSFYEVDSIEAPWNSGVDTEEVMAGRSLAKYRGIAAANGWERAARTAVWDLLFARPYYRALEREFGRRTGSPLIAARVARIGSDYRAHKNNTTYRMELDALLERVEEAVRQAEELVDAHLRGRYNLPLDPVPSVVKDMTVNLARHWLYARRPEGSELPDAVTRTYKSALQMLEAIRDAKLTIGVPTGEAAPEPGEMKVRARARRFDSDLLDRY